MCFAAANSALSMSWLMWTWTDVVIEAKDAMVLPMDDAAIMAIDVTIVTLDVTVARMDCVVVDVVEVAAVSSFL